MGREGLSISPVNRNIPHIMSWYPLAGTIQGKSSSVRSNDNIGHRLIFHFPGGILQHPLCRRVDLDDMQVSRDITEYLPDCAQRSSLEYLPSISGACTSLRRLSIKMKCCSAAVRWAESTIMMFSNPVRRLVNPGRQQQADQITHSSAQGNCRYITQICYKSRPLELQPSLFCQESTWMARITAPDHWKEEFPGTYFRLFVKRNADQPGLLTVCFVHANLFRTGDQPGDLKALQQRLFQAGFFANCSQVCKTE